MLYLSTLEEVLHKSEWNEENEKKLNIDGGIAPFRWGGIYNIRLFVFSESCLVSNCKKNLSNNNKYLYGKFGQGAKWGPKARRYLIFVLNKHNKPLS